MADFDSRPACRDRHNGTRLARLRSACGLVAAAGVLVPVLVAAPAAQAAIPAGCAGVVVPPGADIQSAINSAAEGSTLCLSTSSTYRLGSTLTPKRGMTLWGSATTLDGSRVLSTWVRSGSFWYATGALPAPYTGPGHCEDDTTKPCRLAEQVFRNDVRLKRVMSLSAMGPGRFFADYTANRIYVGDDPAAQRMEVARTARAIASSASNVTVRGLTIQKFATPAQQGAVSAYGSGWKVFDNEIRWNHAVGLHIASANGAVVRNNGIVSNGQLGVSQFNSQSVTLQDNEIANNNTDGFWIADWESGGYKATRSSAVLRGNLIHDNNGVGAWFDIDNKGMTVEYNSILRNAADGIRFEISYDGVIRNNTVQSNGLRSGRGGGTSLYYGAGININTAVNVQVYNNVVAHNINGIGLQMRGGRAAGIYGTYDLRSVVVHNNTVTQVQPTAVGSGVTGLVQDVGNNAYFTSKGNKFYSNVYVLDSFSSRRFAWLNGYVDKNSWTAYGQDALGVFRIG